MLEKIKNNKLLIYTIIPLFLISTILVSKIMMGEELLIDKIATDILVDKLRNPTLTTIMRSITKIGNTTSIIITVIILTLLFLFKWKNKKIAILLPCSLAFSTILNNTLKVIFKRQRPLVTHLVPAAGHSLPSGHSMASMTLYGSLIYIIYHLVKNKIIRNTLITINSLIIFLIGISRVYLGVHYLSDVIVGYSISIIYLLILAKILKKT